MRDLDHVAKTILLLYVEDEAPQFEIVRRVLMESGIKTERAKSVNEAEQRLRQERFDVVLLDLNLRESSGIETFLRVRAATGSRRTPIIVYTGHMDDELEAKLYDEHAFRVLQKGGEPTDVAWAVQSAAKAIPRKDSPAGGQQTIEAIVTGATKAAVEPLVKELRCLTKRVKRIEKSIYPDAPEDDEADEAVDSWKPLRRRPDWAGTIKQIAIAIMTVATTVGTLKMTQAQSTPAPQPQVQQEQRHDEPRWTRRNRDPEGQRGTGGETPAGVTAGP